MLISAEETGTHTREGAGQGSSAPGWGWVPGAAGPRVSQILSHWATSHPVHAGRPCLRCHLPERAWGPFPRMLKTSKFLLAQAPESQGSRSSRRGGSHWWPCRTQTASPGSMHGWRRTSLGRARRRASRSPQQETRHQAGLSAPPCAKPPCPRRACSTAPRRTDIEGSCRALQELLPGPLEAPRKRSPWGAGVSARGTFQAHPTPSL